MTATLVQIRDTYSLPLPHLLRRAHDVHAVHFNPLDVQASQLLSIKTGGCSENCAYCPQSAHYKTGVARDPLLAVDETVEAAKTAKANGATRFCMGAAWREVRDGRDFDRVLDMVSAVSDLGLETCCTLGMLNDSQARRLKDAGLAFYNHNLDTSREHYEKIISTRTYDDRLNTLKRVREAGLSVCTGGILGLGETEDDRLRFLLQLASFDPQPESVSLNLLVPVAGTPLADQQPVPPLDFVRFIATARIFMPKSAIRLSAGRAGLSDEAQFLCLFAGANSMFIGDKLLTSPNSEVSRDATFLRSTGYQWAEPT